MKECQFPLKDQPAVPVDGASSHGSTRYEPWHCDGCGLCVLVICLLGW